ncbi:MAG: cation diffusion facilitator family transporter [Bacteroidota bacterium]
MKTKEYKKKVGVARLSILSNTTLILIKLLAGIFSGSVSIISEAIHSSMDLMAAVIAFFSVRVSGNPPDKKHPYGHGKFENISGVIEALLIFIAAVWIIYEAIHKLYNPAEIKNIEVGAIVMIISALVNVFVSRKLYKVAKETDSVALEADALHLKTDVLTSAGVAVGLLLILVTGNKYPFLDPVVAIIVALFIIYEAFVLLKKAYNPLLDTTLPDDEVELITGAINKHIQENMAWHQLRTRKSGNYSYADFHLEVPESLSVKSSHQLCDDIEAEIRSHFHNIEVQIHIEPMPSVSEEQQ